MARRKQKSDKTRRGKRGKDDLDSHYLEATGEQPPEDADHSLPSVPERQTFGNTPATWMTVQISPDGQQATLTRMTFGGDTTLGAADITTALRDLYFISSGLNETEIDELADRALAEPNSVVKGHFSVASGQAPLPGEDGRIDYIFQRRLDPDCRPAFGAVKAALARESLDDVLADKPLGLLVAPGAELARRIPATQGEPGSDIFGHTSLQPGTDPPLTAGQNVRREDSRFVAETCGYLCLADGKLEILPPLWLTGDAMQAYFIRFPLAAPCTLEPAWLQQALEALGVVHGIDTARIGEFCGNPPPKDRQQATMVARATPARPGADAQIDYAFDPQKRAGKIMPDGSIDLRERNAVIGVEAGQSLGNVVEATPGQPGTDLYGAEIPTTDGQAVDFTAGENVRAEGDPPRSFHSEIAGNFHVGDNTLHVMPVFVVSGDVDYETGNIDSPMDVQVEGAVRGGFTVKAGGSITIGGAIEPGATLSAKGDIVSAQGIIGDNTEITAQGVISMGTVQAKFIQNATVMAKGDIEVGSYIYNSRVRSGGAVTVHAEGGDRGGSIIGGEVYAARRIACRLVGSSSTAGTCIGISPDPQASAQLAKIAKELEFCEHNIVRILRTMGLQTVDAARIKAILRQTPKARQKIMIEIVEKLYELVAARDGALSDRQRLETVIDQALDNAEIEIEGTLFAGVEIAMGNSKLQIRDDMRDVVFYNSPAGLDSRSAASGKKP